LNNLANVDTPFYVAQDLPVKEFQEQLRAAFKCRERGNPRAFNLKPTRMIPINRNGLPRARTVTAKSISQLRHDMGTVDPDMEAAKLAKNAGLHMGLLKLLTHQYGLINDAIVGRPRA
jgi:flagellar basal-body rod protein FlgB